MNKSRRGILFCDICTGLQVPKKIACKYKLRLRTNAAPSHRTNDTQIESSILYSPIANPAPGLFTITSSPSAWPSLSAYPCADKEEPFGKTSSSIWPCKAAANRSTVIIKFSICAICTSMTALVAGECLRVNWTVVTMFRVSFAAARASSRLFFNRSSCSGSGCRCGVCVCVCVRARGSRIGGGDVWALI